MASTIPTWLSGRGFRGHLALVFADLCDYTALGEQHDPEDVEALLAVLAEHTGRVFQQHGGCLVQAYGDGFLGVFGLPALDEHGARSAVEAALALHEQVRATDWKAHVPHGFEVRLHTGVHSGLVIARAGDAVHGSYALTGDAVSTAARLCAAAGRDEVLASRTVLQGSEGFFEIVPLAAPLRLKGKQQPVPAFRVLARSASRTRSDARRRRGLTTFVGRDTELSQLLRAAGDAALGRERLIVVAGTAGIGKSRLLDELRERLARWPVHCFFGTCENHGALRALEPFRQVIRQALDALSEAPDDAGVDGETLRALRQLADETSAAPDDEARCMAALSALVEATQRPLVLLLDDWHWADDSSRKVLASLLRAEAGRRLCVVLGTRDRDAAEPLPARVELLTVAPFSEAISTRVVRLLRPFELDMSVPRALHQRAGGNPLFLEELCRALPERPLDEEQLLQHDAPATVQGVVQARLAALPADCARVAQAAAVIGIEFTRTLLARILDLPSLDATLETLTRLDLVYATEVAGTYRFKHGLARDVIYESVLKEDRQRGHGAIAHVILESTPPDALETQAEALAYHFRGSQDHERAAHFAELAGDKAMSTSTLDRARAHYRAALGALERLPPSVETKRRWLQVSMQWTIASVYSPARDQIEVLQRAARYADELGETGARAETRYSMGWIYYVLGDHGEACEQYGDALALASAAQAGRLVEQLWATLGQSHAAAGRYDEALSYLTQSIERKRGRRGGVRVAQGFAYALGCRAVVWSDRGDFASAARDLDEAFAVLGETRHAVLGSVWALRAMAAIHRESFGDCLVAAERSREICARVNSGYAFATASVYEAYARWKLAGESDALARLRHAVGWLEARGIGLFLSLAHACLADALLEAGQVDDARASAGRALARSDRGDPLGEALACRTLARLCATQGAHGEAETHLARALASAERRASPREEAVTRRLRETLAARPKSTRGSDPGDRAATRPGPPHPGR